MALRIFRLVSGDTYFVERETEREAIEHVERVFGKDSWKAMEIVPERERPKGESDAGLH